MAVNLIEKNLIEKKIEAEPPGTESAELKAGDEPDADTPDYAAFKACVQRKTGIDLNQYKAPQMRRRLTSLLERAHVATFKDYFALIERDANEWNVFLNRVTINVSELFRNPEKWEDLHSPILTEWLNPARAPNAASVSSALSGELRRFKAWSAGCSYGAEPYSLAILLDQIWPGQTTTLHATDLDRAILARAAQGRFTAADAKNVKPDVLKQYFTPTADTTRKMSGERPAPAGTMPTRPDADTLFQMRPDIGRRVAFRPHNLLADRFETDYDLICCRNVVIYFTDEAKQTLYKRFQQALRPGGILFVGSTERIFNYQELGFDMPLPFFYRRVR